MAPERKTGSGKKTKKSIFSRLYDSDESAGGESVAPEAFEETTVPELKPDAAAPVDPKPVAEVKKSAPEPAPEPEKKPERRVVLRNLRNRRVTFNLPHEIYCVGAGECFCDEQVHRRYTENMKERKEWVIEKKIRVCSSVSIGPRGQSVPLQPAALECPEIRQALRAQPTRLQAVHKAGP